MEDGECTKCPVGAVQNPTNKAQCKNCSIDEAEKMSYSRDLVFYSDFYDSTGKTFGGICTKCPVGAVQDQSNKAQCKNCTTNEAETIDGICEPCPIGSIQDPDNKAQC